MRTVLFAIAAVLVALPATAQTAGYVGQQTRDVKALSAGEMADLLAGRGMGLARAAELNHYPGPAHVLELRGKLMLTADQLARVQESFDRMAGLAKPLGAELVERERTLDDAFKHGSVTPDSVARQTSAIGALQAELRAVHLAAHLDMRAVLTAEQVTTYDTLRGYSGTVPNETPAPNKKHHG